MVPNPRADLSRAGASAPSAGLSWEVRVGFLLPSGTSQGNHGVKGGKFSNANFCFYNLLASLMLNRVEL